MISVDLANATPFLKDTPEVLAERAAAAHRMLVTGSGAGSECLGWREVLLDPNDALLEDIVSTARRIRAEAEVLVCIGIGGSYLGAKAVISALSPYFGSRRNGNDDEDADLEILFAGHHMSGTYMRQLLEYLEGKSVFLNVISKSGTTLEPALAFRFLRDWLEQRFEDADARIIVTTDPEQGALNQMRATHPYKKYEIPPSVGGRFSVLTPVGLLPIAAAGFDIRGLFYGARSMCQSLRTVEDGDARPIHDALAYASTRYALHQQGYDIDVLAVFEPRLSPFAGWWQQLFGESEGKDGRGLFPASVQYSTDLHSLGQYMQDGRRVVTETFLMMRKDGGALSVESEPDDLDGLNYLKGRTWSEINRRAYEGTAEAHTAGGVPNVTIWMDELRADTLGELIYFFEHAVAVGGYLLRLNPFDQPGVEAYKKAMFRLLGRP